MDFRSLILRSTACAAIILLGSCIDGREEIWVNADGSGRADVSYSLPAAAAKFRGGESGVRRMLEEFLKNAPGISNSNCDVTTEGGRLKIRVRTTFTNALELKEISKGDAMSKLPSSATGLTGEFNVAARGLSVDFARTIHAGDSLPGAGLIPVSQFKDRQLTYIYHLPVVATSSNATRTEDSGCTLIWDIPLAQAIQGPVTTRFTAPIPLPRWAVFATCIFGAVIAIIVGRKLFRPKSPTG